MFWILAPGIEMAEQLGQIPWLTATIGFMGGGIFMRVIDKFLPHLHPGLKIDQSEGVKTSLQRSTLLVLAITLHNIPEGLAVGGYWPLRFTISLKVLRWAWPLARSPLAFRQPPSGGQLPWPSGSAFKTSPKAPLYPCPCVAFLF